MKRFNGNIAGRLCRPVCIFHPERVSQKYRGKSAVCVGSPTGIQFRAECGESAVRRFADRNPVSRGARGIRRFCGRSPGESRVGADREKITDREEEKG